MPRWTPWGCEVNLRLEEGNAQTYETPKPLGRLTRPDRKCHLPHSESYSLFLFIISYKLQRRFHRTNPDELTWNQGEFFSHEL